MHEISIIYCPSNSLTTLKLVESYSVKLTRNDLVTPYWQLGATCSSRVINGDTEAH